MTRARLPFALLLALAALAVRGAVGCGTQPCFRHSDCSSNEICSMGNCIPAPVDLPPPVVDGGGLETSTDSPAQSDDTSKPTSDASDASVRFDADASESAEASDSPDGYDETDAARD